MSNPCPECGLDRDFIGLRHRCVPRRIAVPVAEAMTDRVVRGGEVRARTGSATLPTAAKPRRGRPRLEEAASTLTALKPWEKTTPPMSRATWYKRQKGVRR